MPALTGLPDALVGAPPLQTGDRDGFRQASTVIFAPPLPSPELIMAFPTAGSACRRCVAQSSPWSTREGSPWSTRRSCPWGRTDRRSATMVWLRGVSRAFSTTDFFIIRELRPGQPPMVRLPRLQFFSS